MFRCYLNNINIFAVCCNFKGILTSNGRTCQHWNLFFVFVFFFIKIVKQRRPPPPSLILFILVRSREFEITVLVQSFLNSQYSHYRVSSTFTIKINIISWKWKKLKEVPSRRNDLFAKRIPIFQRKLCLYRYLREVLCFHCGWAFLRISFFIILHFVCNVIS